MEHKDDGQQVILNMTLIIYTGDWAFTAFSH